ncbi:hypothetical protein PQE12_gp51 [Arthrobacter phage Adumb2043]|uniref:Uncharacterized protein n=1 Tax=Arthrobacter phage Adumb2043 TaxID=2776851 RepID=A0A7M1CL26_9CAUD|nr:hypothetical protein PQE12_gp51 [Arthrobacter phage Adumb2043]QOP65111.1 hypothetical protein SEA_ADUMB2043_51 [Arthrobacter phage Adumb2043]
MTDFTHTDDDGDSIEIESDPDHARAVVSSEDGRAVYVPKDDAPAVALAILTAAGITAKSAGGYDERAAWLLNRVAESRAAEKAAKEAEAKLEAEALALLNAATDSCYTAFAHDAIRDTWLRAARRARELHN